MSGALSGGYATTPDQRIDELRHSGVRLAVELLVDGDAGGSQRVILQSVEQQARIAGVRCDLTSWLP